MGSITTSREAKCSDCKHFKYYYEGNRKYHICEVTNQRTTLRDKFPKCPHLEIRLSYYPEKRNGYEKWT